MSQPGLFEAGASRPLPPPRKPGRPPQGRERPPAPAPVIPLRSEAARREVPPPLVLRPPPGPPPKPVRIDYKARREAFDAAVREALLHYDHGPGPRVPSPEWLAASAKAMELGKALPWFPMGWIFGSALYWHPATLQRYGM